MREKQQSKNVSQSASADTVRYHPYVDRKSNKEHKPTEEKTEEDEDIYFFETWYIPRHMLMNILQYLDLKSLVDRGLLINRKFYKLIVDDGEGVLWRTLCSKQAPWLKPLYYDLRKSLKSKRHKWMRFLSIFTDNYNEWNYEPNYSGTADQDFKLFSNSREAFSSTTTATTANNNNTLPTTTATTNGNSNSNTNTTSSLSLVVETASNTKQTVQYLGNPKNTSSSSTYPITAKTVKCFHIKLDKKPQNSNVGIGLAEKNFLQLERKFIGFNPFNIGCSSNGRARFFFPYSQERHVDENCSSFVEGDLISILVDMLGNQAYFYVNGKLSYHFTNIDFRSFDPYRITVTMFSSGDQFSFTRDAIPFTISNLLEIYDNCEKTFDLYYSSLSDIKIEFKELADQFINMCEDKSFILKTKATMKTFIDNNNSCSNNKKD